MVESLAPSTAIVSHSNIDHGRRGDKRAWLQVRGSAISEPAGWPGLEKKVIRRTILQLPCLTKTRDILHGAKDLPEDANRGLQGRRGSGQLPEQASKQKRIYSQGNYR